MKQELQNRGWVLKEDSYGTWIFYKEDKPITYILSVFNQNPDKPRARLIFSTQEYDRHNGFNIYREIGDTLYQGRCTSIEEFELILDMVGDVKKYL